ncbi:hypothetical protein P154DRAFT_558979 [Amniculicola lignicola CBS 123094]|uniref:Uncharacterized protein n=1 Tax=Amniculicola lignicola CBS 123094 TaxID=1392246 RepID=A0A6A5WZU5_9PLEO|nr:hypothetical protein P154DRAFT_558979 [Amniculicola lignicola CBS 123094]
MADKEFETNVKGYNLYCRVCDRGFTSMMGPGGMDDHLSSYAHRNAKAHAGGSRKFHDIAREQAATKAGTKRKKEDEEDEGYEWIKQLDTGKKIRVPKKSQASDTTIRSALPTSLRSAQDDVKPTDTREVIDWTPYDPTRPVLCDGTNPHCIGCNPALHELFMSLLPGCFDDAKKDTEAEKV